MTAQERLKAARPEVRRAVLELLDEISAPMTARELEQALCRNGFSRSKARPVVNALKHLPVIALGQRRAPE